VCPPLALGRRDATEPSRRGRGARRRGGTPGERFRSRHRHRAAPRRAVFPRNRRSGPITDRRRSVVAGAGRARGGTGGPGAGMASGVRRRRRTGLGAGRPRLGPCARAPAPASAGDPAPRAGAGPRPGRRDLSTPGAPLEPSVVRLVSCSHRGGIGPRVRIRAPRSGRGAARATLELEAVVRTYVDTAEPAGSRNVARRHELGISRPRSATR
jgi:hypothetical protein